MIKRTDSFCHKPWNTFWILFFQIPWNAKSYVRLYWHSTCIVSFAKELSHTCFFSHLRTNMIFWSHYYSSMPRSGQVYAFYSFCIGCQKGATIDFYINVAIFFLLASFNLNLNAFCGVHIPSYALFCVVLKTFSCGSKKPNHKCSLSIFVKRQICFFPDFVISWKLYVYLCIYFWFLDSF